MNNTNWLAVIACVIFGMAMGFLWYGALFQEIWMTGNGISMDGDTMLKNGNAVEQSATPMIVNTLAMILYAIVLNWLINATNSTTLTKGLKLGLIIGIFPLMDNILTNLFAANSFELSLIDGSYMLILIGGMGAILGGWRKK